MLHRILNILHWGGESDSYYLDPIKDSLSTFFTQFSLFVNKKFSSKTTFLIFIAIYSISLFSLLRENINYIDDVDRTALGYTGWIYFSRYSSEYLSQVLHANSYLADISPIPQIIAIIELSLACLYLIKGISGKREFTIWQIAASLPLGLNPYFLECLSYKFDSPYMALSVLIAVVPLLFIKHAYLFFIFTVISINVICTSYQASLGILPMTVIFTLLSLYIKGESLRSVLKTGLIFAASFVVGFLIFKILIMNPVQSYVSNSIAPLSELPRVFYEHMKNYYLNLVIPDSPKLWKRLTKVGLITLTLFAVFNSKSNKILTLIFTLFTLIVALILTYGFYACLEKPLFAPRALYGIGAVIACILVLAVSNKDLYIAKICSIIFAWSFVVVASAYGNALVAQRNWEEFRIGEVIQDLTTIENNGQPFKYRTLGSAGHAPAIRNLNFVYPVIGRLVPVTFGDSGWMWNVEKFNKYYEIRNMTQDNSITDTGYPDLVKETMYHKIMVFKDKLLIILK